MLSVCMLDGIEQNVETAASDISEGNRQLGTAVKYKVTMQVNACVMNYTSLYNSDAVGSSY